MFFNRRTFLKEAGNCVLAAALPPRGQGASSRLAGRRPNIILILPDDQGKCDMDRQLNPLLQRGPPASARPPRAPVPADLALARQLLQEARSPPPRRRRTTGRFRHRSRHRELDVLRMASAAAIARDRTGNTGPPSGNDRESR